MPPDPPSLVRYHTLGLHKIWPHHLQNASSGPEQGVRGKTRWIFDESDIEDMYSEYQEAAKSEIIIWCDGRTKTPLKCHHKTKRLILNPMLRKTSYDKQ